MSLLQIALGAIDSPPLFAASPAPPTTFEISQFQPGKSLRLVAYGDTRFTDPSVVKGTNPRVRKWLADRIVLEHPQAILLTGDTPYTGGKDGDWEDYQQETAAWRTSHTLVLPTTGNHETYGGRDRGLANYLKNFLQVEGHLYYSAILGNVEVISLDCNQGTSPESPQATWFASQLTHIPRKIEFLLILYHTPWVADRQSQMFANLPTKEAINLRSILETYLPKFHARVLVFNGHIHNYERFERLRVEYVVTGGGGAEP